MKSSRITNWIKWSEIEWVMLPDKIVNSKLLKKILWIRVFDLSGIIVGCRRSGVKKYEHIALHNCELPDSMLIFIKLLLKLPIKKPNFSSPFSFFKIGVTYFGLKSAIDMLRRYFSLVARYLLKFTCYSLQNPLVTPCRSCSF